MASHVNGRTWPGTGPGWPSWSASPCSCDTSGRCAAPIRIVALAGISAGSFAWALALSVGRTLWVGHRGCADYLSPRRAAVITAGTLALALAAFALSLVSSS